MTDRKIERRDSSVGRGLEESDDTLLPIFDVYSWRTSQLPLRLACWAGTNGAKGNATAPFCAIWNGAV